MPIYEYECTSCGKRFELQQKFSDPLVKTCDQFSCPEAKPVNKIISAPAIMFKGTGWYVTDYSDKMKEPATQSENKGQPTEVKDSKSKSESQSSTDSSSDTTTPSPSSGATSDNSSSSGSSGSNSSSSGTGASSSSSTSP